jgi:hypothetical protein
MLLQVLKVGCSLRIAPHKDLRSHLRKLQGLETTIIVNGDLSFLMCDGPTLWVLVMLTLELENSSRFSLAFGGCSLSDVVVFKILKEPEGIEGKGMNFLDLFWI